MNKNKRLKTGDVVTTKHGSYFINGVPPEFENKPEWFLCQHDVKVFFAKHLDETTYPAAEMRTWFPSKQPTEAQVSNAMIWASDHYHDYSIKAGGGAIADKQFSSHLKITIADPRTSFDKDVVLLKKYSSKFDEVLVSIDEVQTLEDATEPPARKEANRKSLLLSMLREIIRWFKGIKSTGDGKEWTAANIAQMLKQCSEDYTEQEVKAGLERLSEYARNFDTRQLTGGTGQEYLNFLMLEIKNFKLPLIAVPSDTGLISPSNKGEILTVPASLPKSAQQLSLFG
jgi:hypothetical protein